MESVSTRLTLAALLLTLATPLFAASYIVPPDAELIRSADAIAIVTIESSHAYRADDGTIATDYSAAVERSLRSPLRAGMKITVTRRGGTLGGLTFVDTSQPRFQTGERTLLLMERVRPGSFRTVSGELGKFSFVTDVELRSLLVRGASGDEINGWDLSGRPHMDRPRDAAAFLSYIEGVVAGNEPAADYFLSESALPRDRVQTLGGVGAYEYSEDSVPRPARWDSFTMQNTNDQPGESNTVGLLQNAMGGWNGAGGSSINLSYGGVDATGIFGGTVSGGNPDQENYILFNQPNSGPLAGSTVGVAQYWHGSPVHQFLGSPFDTMVDCDIVIESGFTGSLMQAIVGHELGHCIGFRHSNQPVAALGQTTNTTNALMNSSVNADPSLRQWDQDAASHLYGDGTPVCNAPAINQHPASQTITSGNSATLTVGATGTGPLSYQWYQGTPTDTSTPLGTGASINVSPTATTSYWARVSHECSSAVANSNAATITVNPFVCPSVSVGAPQAQVQSNGTYRLSVTATSSGRPLIFEWFQGTTPGVGGTFVGLTSQIFVPASTVDTSYWVRVTNDCENSAVSGVVVVPACVLPAINTQPQDQSILSGASATLSLTHSASNATVRWFRGVVGNTSTQIGTGNSVNTGALTATTLFFALVSNSCGDTASRQVTVTVAGCDLAAITTQPVDQTIANGASATLSVVFNSASAATVRWYRGALGDKTNQIGTGASVSTGALTTTTTFWAGITNACGETSTRLVTITVSACTGPAITTQSTAQKILSNRTVTLNVTATGTAPLTYQWYEGAVGITTKPVGTNSPTFTSAPLTSSTSFWVKVTNACGNAESAAIVVTVTNGKKRVVRS